MVYASLYPGSGIFLRQPVPSCYLSGMSGAVDFRRVAAVFRASSKRKAVSHV